MNGGPVSRRWILVAALPILSATLAPLPGSQVAGHRFLSSLVPSTAGDWFDVIANIALYVPLGLAISVAGGTSFHSRWTAAILSIAVEVLQFLIPGRDPTASDIIANVSGAQVGSLLGSHPLGITIRHKVWTLEQHLIRVELSRSLAGRYALFWAVTVAGVFALTGMLLSPAPVGAPYSISGPFVDRGSGALRIGANGRAGGHFRGVIDDVRIYEHSLSADSVRGDMSRPVAAGDFSQAGLIAAYGFEAGRGAIAHDDSGHGHHGIIGGASWIPDGRFGGGLFFDGQESEVLVPEMPELDLRDRMTLEAWVFPIGAPAPWPAVIARADNNYYLYASSNSGPLQAAGGGRFVGSVGGSVEDARLTEAIQPSQWTHLAVTYDAKAIRLYVNGSLAATNVRWSPHQPTSASLNGNELCPGAIVDDNRLRSFIQREVTLRATVRCGPLAPEAAPLFKITDAGNIDAVAVVAEGADLLVRHSTWARLLKLSSPDLHISGALRACDAGNELEVRLEGHLQNPRVSLNGRDASGTSLGLGSGWAFVIHSELLPRWLALICTAVWFCLLLFPYGLWARLDLNSTIGLVIIAVAVYVTPRIWHVRPPEISEMMVICLGAVLGMSCRLAFDGPEHS